MTQKLNQLTIHGFKSIRNLDDFELQNINILIGANGTGKSNFIDFFRLLRAIMEKNLEGFTAKNGGADGFFFNGHGVPKIRERCPHFDDWIQKLEKLEEERVTL